MNWLWWRLRLAVAAVLEAGALYFDAINDRQHKPPQRRDDDPKPCRHPVRLNRRCLNCGSEA